MIFTVVFYVFVVFTAIQVIYYLTFSSFLFTSKKNNKKSTQDPFSVIVFAKNNAEDLEKNLPFILEQEYPEFQVVLVNGASTDNTLDVMEAFRDQHSNIKILDVENNEAFWASKKYALTLGIKAAKYENLVFTEANCKPVSKYWLAEISSKFIRKKTIVLGYTKFKREKGFTNILLRFYNLLSAIQCFSFAKMGSSFMAFYGNYAYDKSEFFRVKGFIYHIKVKEGENDLFIRDAANKENVNYTISPNSFVETDAPNSLKSWMQERRNKLLLKKHYKLKHLFLLNFFTFSKGIFYVLAIILFFTYPWQLILPFVLTYFIVQYIVIGISANKLKEPQLIFILPFLEIGLLLIQFSIFIANLISKPNH